MAENTVDYAAIKTELDAIAEDAEEISKELKAFDALMTENVGNAGVTWSGTSASGFDSSWQEEAENIPARMETVRNQARNIDNMLLKTRAVDTADTGKVTLTKA